METSLKLRAESSRVPLIGHLLVFVQRSAVVRRGCGGSGILRGLNLDSRLFELE
jgi:hypothetical protein